MQNTPHNMIMGTGRAVPQRVLTNKDLEKIVDTSNDWIMARTGIEQRHIAEPGTPLSALAVEASKKAIDEAGIAPEEIDLVILGTVTGDMKFPATACLIQEQVGAVHAAAFDLSAACSGFLYGMQMADSLMRTCGYRHVLVVAGEILSSMINWQDRNTCVLFGDGAGAAVLGPSKEDRGVLSTHLGADGSFNQLLYNPGCGSLNPPTEENVRSNLATIRMEGRDVFRHALVSMEKALKVALELANVSMEELDIVLPHQANMRIIEGLAKRCRVPMDKVYVNVHRYGNTSAASIPIALDELRRSGQVQPGSLVGMVTFGAGLTWASGIVRM